MKAGVAGIVVAILAIVVLFWVLKIAVKLAFIAVIAVGAVALFYAAKKRIGGPRA